MEVWVSISGYVSDFYFHHCVTKLPTVSESLSIQDGAWGVLRERNQLEELGVNN
jgi:hypothetical protein